MGLREAWAALTGRGITSDAVAKAAQTLDVFGAPDAKEQARGMLAGVLPYSQPPKRGSLGLMMLYATAPGLRAVVSRVAQRIAATEWQVDKLVDASGKAIRSKSLQDSRSRDMRRGILKRLGNAGAETQPIEDHPVLEFLRTGNTVLDGRTAMQVTATHVLLKGEAYWLIERWMEGPLVGLPRYFWPVPPFWVAETPTVNRPFYRMQFAGWHPTHVPESEVIRFTDPDPFNPIGRGVGLGEALTDELDSDEYGKKWIKGRLYNQGIPRTVVSMEGGSETEAKRIQEEWRQSFTGVMNHFKTWFTPRKLTISQLEPKFEEMKLLELRSSIRDGVLEQFGYPKELLGILDNANRSTIDTAEFRLEKYGIEPWREFFRHGLQHRLMPTYSDKAVLDYVDEVPANREFMLQAAKVRPYAFTNNAVLEIAGAEVTEEAWGEERPPTPVTAPTDAEVIPGGGGGLGAGKAARDPEWARELAARRKASGDEQDDQDVAAFTEDHIDDVVDAVFEDDVALGADELQAVLEKNVRELGGKVARELGLAASAFDHRDPKVRQYLEDQSSDAITAINDTTKAEIREALTKVAKDGGSIRDAGREIRKYFEGCSTDRSNLIAQTENLRASGHATQSAFTQSGLELKKYWQHGGGETDPREGHQDLAEQEPIDLDEPFVNPETGVSMLYPGESGDPGEDCGCHCSHWVKAPEAKAAAVAPTSAQQRAWRAAGERRIRTVAKAAFARQQRAALKALKGAR